MTTATHPHPTPATAAPVDEADVRGLRAAHDALAKFRDSIAQITGRYYEWDHGWQAASLADIEEGAKRMREAWNKAHEPPFCLRVGLATGDDAVARCGRTFPTTTDDLGRVDCSHCLVSECETLGAQRDSATSALATMTAERDRLTADLATARGALEAIADAHEALPDLVENDLPWELAKTLERARPALSASGATKETT